MIIQRTQDLRAELSRLHSLATKIHARERLKRDTILTQHTLLSTLLFPHYSSMKTIFERIRGHDKQDVFKYPVNRAEVPGYYDVIEKPMWWGVIEGRLDGIQDQLQTMNEALSRLLPETRPQGIPTISLPQSSSFAAASSSDPTAPSSDRISMISHERLEGARQVLRGMKHSVATGIQMLASRSKSRGRSRSRAKGKGRAEDQAQEPVPDLPNLLK